jgi:(p)ppGpp synthase/HD superfamily hydrolase
MDKVQLAINLACSAHEGQTYGGAPYTKHLSDVINVLRRFGYTSEEDECYGWLHDILEDTKTSYGDLKHIFGTRIAETVYLVTNEKGRNRAEKAERTYPKIKGHIRATRIKLADRIANVEASIGTKKFDMYRKEYDSFVEYLYVEGELLDMWKYLKSLFKDK